MRLAFVVLLLAVGLAFSLSGAVGVVRMPDVYTRLQCATKTVTLGTLAVLVALVVGEGPISNYGGRALIIAVLILVMSPAASHALLRAAYKTGVPLWRGSAVDEPRERREEADR